MQRYPSNYPHDRLIPTRAAASFCFMTAVLSFTTLSYGCQIDVSANGQTGCAV